MSVIILPAHMRLDPTADVFKLYTHDDLKRLPPAQWIVKGIIPTAGVGAIYGPSQSGKTFLSLDLGAHISWGMPWFGRKVRASPVIYIPLEGQGGIPKRSDAWEMKHKKVTGIHYLQDGINLLDGSQVTEFIAQVRRRCWNSQVVLFVDTLAQASAGLQENGSEMTAILAVGQRLARELPAVVIFVHHSGHSETDRMRGWSGLPAAMDFSIACNTRGDAQYDRQFTLAKVKDGEGGITVPFKLEKLTLGLDADADPITSLVAVQVHEAKVAPTALDASDDDFIWTWINKAVEAGTFPSARSLNADLNAMKTAHPGITVKRIGGAIARLQQASRVSREPKSPSGNAWLRAVDAPGGTA